MSPRVGGRAYRLIREEADPDTQKDPSSIYQRRQEEWLAKDKLGERRDYLPRGGGKKGVPCRRKGGLIQSTE